MVSALGCVVLAAGASTRMGRPKALLEWRGRPFFVCCIELASGVGCTPIVVVEGATTLPRPAPGAAIATNTTWQDGPLSSLQTGLRMVLAAATPAGVLVLTVDRPHVRPTTVLRVAEVFAKNPSCVVQPQHDGRRAHPIVYPLDLCQRLLALPPTDTPRTLLGDPGVMDRRLCVGVDDPAVLENIDTPEALTRLVGDTG